MIRAHQPGSQPIDVPEVIPNPAVPPKREPAPKGPAPREPVKAPETVPRRWGRDRARCNHKVSDGRLTLRARHGRVPPNEGAPHLGAT
jgi:hypothetical protein